MNWRGGRVGFGVGVSAIGVDIVFPLRNVSTKSDQAQVPRLRQALITIGVQVVRSVRRIVLHLPRSHPDAVPWAQIARALGAARA